MTMLLPFVQRLPKKSSCHNLQQPGSESDLQFLDNSGAKDPPALSLVSVPAGVTGDLLSMDPQILQIVVFRVSQLTA